MTINGKALFDALVMLSEKDKMRSTVGYSVLSGTVAAVSFGACIPFGPFGPPIGLGLSSLGMYLLTKNKYRSVAKVLMEDLTVSEQKQLIDLLTDFAKDLDFQDVMEIVCFFTQPSKTDMLLALKRIANVFLNSRENPKKRMQ